MKIRKVKLYPIHTSRKLGKYTQHVIVKVDTNSGLVGIGEMTDLTELPMIMPDLDDLEGTLNNILQGLDPMRVNQIDKLLTTFFTGRGSSGIYEGTISCGIDIAIHDLIGKYLEIPLYKYLGGPLRTEIETCYPLFKHYTREDIELSIKRVRELLEEDIHLFRVYVGGNPDMDELLLKRAREVFNSKIRIKSYDFSGRLNGKQSLTLLEQLRKYYEPQIVESICPRNSISEMAWTRKKINLPVCEHVSSMKEALSFYNQEAVDVININTTSMGGVLGSMKMFSLAEAMEIQCLIGTNQEFDVGTAAQLHIGAAVPNLHYPSDMAGPLLYNTDIVKNQIGIKSGFMQVPSSPGLGIEIDWERLKEISQSLEWHSRKVDQRFEDIHSSSWKIPKSPGFIQGGGYG